MEYSSFFNSIGGDRKYRAEDMARHFGRLLTNGVFPSGTQLQVTPAAGGGMNVSLSPGSAWINGYAYHNDNDLTLTIAAADGVLQRRDRIVIRWDRLARQITAQVITGIPASSPAAPALVRTIDRYDLGVATVLIPANATLVTAENITDTRPMTDACGFVSSLITPDTSGWFAHFTAAFTEWFAGVQDALDGETAGNLYNLISAHAANYNNPHNVTAELIGAQSLITVSGLLKGSGGGAILPATANKDYYTPPLRAANLSVQTSAWASNATYADFPYRAAVPVSGAVASMIPDVVFALVDAISGVLAPVAEAYAGGVYIYAAEIPSTTISIKTLTLWKAVVS